MIKLRIVKKKRAARGFGTGMVEIYEQLQVMHEFRIVDIGDSFASYEIDKINNPEWEDVPTVEENDNE